MNFKPKNLLLIFQLSNTLLYTQKGQSRIAQAPLSKSVTFHDSILNGQYSINYRSGRQQFLEYFFHQQQKSIDVAVWTSLNREFAESISKKYFSRYFRNLLFIAATDRTLYGAQKQPQTNLPIKKNLNQIYTNFPGYNEGNTLVVSTSQNLLSDYKRNDVIIPEYNPQNNSFEIDPGMLPFVKYIRGILDSQRVYNLTDIRSMIAAKNLAAMFKRISHNIYSEREYN